MIKLNVGCNFDESLIEKVKELNAKYIKNGVQVAEFYGSLPKGVAGLPTARPDFRLPAIDTTKLREFVIKLREAGFAFNYTLNSSLTSEWFAKSKEDYYDIIRILRLIDPDIVTVAHHLPLRYLSREFDIEISTIFETNTVNGLAYYVNNYTVNKICVSIAKNRNAAFLEGARKAGLNEYVELLANEFCNFGGTFCQQFTRKSCYELHGLGGNKELHHEGFPLLWCSASRYRHPSAFLKAPVIYPWDIKYYRDTFGITHFKLSGRTLPTDYILKTVEAYLSLGEVMDDNVLALWGHVDQVGKGKDKLMKVPAIYIDKEKLRKENFVKSILVKRLDCESVLCEDCQYCEKVFKKTRKEFKD